MLDHNDGERVTLGYLVRNDKHFEVMRSWCGLGAFVCAITEELDHSSHSTRLVLLKSNRTVVTFLQRTLVSPSQPTKGINTLKDLVHALLK